MKKKMRKSIKYIQKRKKKRKLWLKEKRTESILIGWIEWKPC